MAGRPYHKYVFDTRKRRFVGKFEQMYAREDRDGFDSWYQEDLTHPIRRLAMALLDGYSFRSVLDIGCGKGVFTHVLKKANTHVAGTDISATAIAKARVKFPGITFTVCDAFEALRRSRGVELVVAMEILSYIER